MLRRQYNLIKQFIIPGTVGYTSDELDFNVMELDYYIYVKQCEASFIEPLKPKSKRNGRLYFIVKFADIQED